MVRLFVFVLSLFALRSALAQPQRLALVIGNDSYSAVSPLVNARADANAIAQALTKSGFKVTLRTNVDLNGFKQALRTFKAELRGGDEAIFFFAGHGVELSGANFLLPTDIKGDTEDQVRDDAVPLQRVLEDMQDRKTGFALAIIDACRNNPFRERGRAIGGRGLAATNAATGQMVLYSAGTGQRALDQLGPRDPVKNGVFTRVLLREMQKPGVPVADVLRNVREVVAQLAKSVGEEQVPAIYDQSLGRFYFTQPVVAERTPDLSPTQLEARFWDDTKAAGNKEAFEAYLKEYPTGRYANLARANIVRLSTPVATAPPPVVVAPPQPAPSGHFAAPTTPEALRRVLVATGAYWGSPQ
ncbi:MAG: caspase domain-containing protein, partial [Planctomycetota bacterium]